MSSFMTALKPKSMAINEFGECLCVYDQTTIPHASHPSGRPLSLYGPVPVSAEVYGWRHSRDAPPQRPVEGDMALHERAQRCKIER